MFTWLFALSASMFIFYISVTLIGIVVHVRNDILIYVERPENHLDTWLLKLVFKKLLPWKDEVSGHIPHPYSLYLLASTVAPVSIEMIR